MLTLAFSATASFGADFGTSDITDTTSVHDLALTEMKVTFGLSSATQNVALVAQSGTGNNAYIQQSDGNGNFAATIQDTTVGAAAYTVQSGNSNRAVVYQH